MCRPLIRFCRYTSSGSVWRLSSSRLQPACAACVSVPKPRPGISVASKGSSSRPSSVFAGAFANAASASWPARSGAVFSDDTITASRRTLRQTASLRCCALPSAGTARSSSRRIDGVSSCGSMPSVSRLRSSGYCTRLFFTESWRNAASTTPSGSAPSCACKGYSAIAKPRMCGRVKRSAKSA